MGPLSGRVLDVNLRKPYFDDALIRESVGMSTVLKLSDDELQPVLKACGISLSDDIVKTLQELKTKYDLEVVAMTRGAEGAIVVTDHETLDQPGIPTTVCDTVGAGDAFTAAFVVGMSSGASMRSVIANACKVASDVCSYSGAVRKIASCLKSVRKL